MIWKCMLRVFDHLIYFRKHRILKKWEQLLPGDIGGWI